MRELRIEVPVFSNYVFEHSTSLSLGSLSSNVEYSFPLNSSDTSADKAHFDQKFAARFGKDALPTPNSYFVKDGLDLLARALTNCPSADAQCIAKYFKSTTSYSGLSGEFAFRADGTIERPYGIKKVEGDQFVWVTKKLELGKGKL